MLTHYLVLGLSRSATEKEIRQRYLELVRTYPPARNPEKFRQIDLAYEALKDCRSRVDAEIFGHTAYPSCEAALDALLKCGSVERRTPGLKTLLAHEGVLDENDDAG